MQKILVIEDDQLVRNAMINSLQSAKFEVVSAANGQAGVRLAKEHEPDLILCDMMMPGWTGYQVQVALEQHARTASIPVIFLRPKLAQDEECCGKGPTSQGDLAKPFTRDELLRAIALRLRATSSVIHPRQCPSSPQEKSADVYTDPLTALPNRSVFHHRLKEALTYKRKLQHSVVVCYINLAQFTQVNERYGYAVGDRILCTVADRLRQAVTEPSTLARLGDDEFGLLICYANSPQGLQTVAQTIQSAIAQPIQLGGESIQLMSSIGLAQQTAECDNPGELLHHARVAMRQAKRKGAGAYHIYDAQQDSGLEHHQWMRLQLRQALERREFYLEYQPQVNLQTGQIIGVEALLRWQHPTLGTVYPHQFLPLAHEAGVMVPINEWVLKTACCQAQTWQTQCRTPLTVAVNLSKPQLQQSNLVEHISRVAFCSGVDPVSLSLDVSEAMLLEDHAHGYQTLQRLRQLGVSITVDDCGLELLALLQCQQMPIDSVKIDRASVQKIAVSADSLAVAKAIVAIADLFQIQAIAKGVEALEQLSVLRQIGYYAMQGHVFSPSVSSSAIAEMLRANKRM